MKIYIDKVNPGSTYMETIYDYRIYGKTESGFEIIIFDDKYDLRNYQGKTIECLINAILPQEIDKKYESKETDPRHPQIEGSFIGKYAIPKKWKPCEKQNDLLYAVDRHAVETKDGIIIIDTDEYVNSLNKGDHITFTVGRLDLMAWLPLEN
ncbi:MAG: hypothetical protein ACFFDF_09230 [Candidatus Odinarchaeota archaeon]